ncbi:MAG: CBS domain-containing protein [Thermoplasmatales archaeon]|nr:MAG: CBS domain-containing protein [Thermoplasmatales archaeon]
MIVKEIMTKNVITIGSNESVLNACKKYRSEKVGSLVVMDDDIIVGILTERDIIESLILINGDPKKAKVRDIMSRDIKTVHALAPLEKAAQIMKENNIKKLPVILNNEIVGIVTETDLSRTIPAFSDAIDELTEFYATSRETLEKMMDDWGNILISLKNFKKLIEKKEMEVIKE